LISRKKKGDPNERIKCKINKLKFTVQLVVGVLTLSFVWDPIAANTYGTLFFSLSAFIGSGLTSNPLPASLCLRIQAFFFSFSLKGS